MEKQASMDLNYRAKDKIEEKHGVDFIIDTLMQEPENSVSLCPLGPLTNIATAILKEPRITPRIKQIVLMGEHTLKLGILRQRRNLIFL